MPFDPSKFLDQLQSITTAQSLNCLERSRSSRLCRRSIKTPEMDNSTADWLIRRQHCRQKPSEVLCSFGTYTKMLTVRALVGFASTDKDSAISLRAD